MMQESGIMQNVPTLSQHQRLVYYGLLTDLNNCYSFGVIRSSPAEDSQEVSRGHIPFPEPRERPNCDL